MLKSKKLVIVLVVLIFMMPGMCAYWLYQHPSWWQAATTNKGELLAKPVLVDALPKTPQWGLLLWNPGPCDPICRQQLNKLVRIRLALGRRFYDVNLWLISNRTLSNTETADLWSQQRIRSLTLSTSNLATLIVLDHKPKILIVNPDNYLILNYSLTAAPADIYSDLQRVMNLQRGL